MHVLTQYMQLGKLQIALPLADGTMLACEHLLRVLPHRRWVVRGTWHAQAVVAKIFSGQHAARYAARDAKGAQLFAQAGIATPALLWRGQSHDATAIVLIYAAIDAAESAESAYQRRCMEQKQALMTQLSRVLAQQHMAQLRQTDLHLDNFLIQQNKVWSIDGDGVQHQTISKSCAYRDLARLISKITVQDQIHVVGTCLAAYDQQCGWAGDMLPARLLQMAIQQHRTDAWRFAAHKVFRSCSDVRWQRTPSQTLALVRASALTATDVNLDNLEAWMQQGVNLKAGNTSTVVHVTFNGMPLVIKRYNIKSFWHAVSRAWRPSRAAHAWRNAHLLRYFGIATPSPLCLLETRRFGLRGKAYFIAAHSPWPDAMQFFKQSTDVVLHAEAIKQLVKLCYQLYVLQLSHGDLKASNLQITDTGEIVVLDLDSLQLHRCPYFALRAHARDIRRLLQNWKADASLYNALVEQFNVIYQDDRPLKLAGIAHS